MQPEVIISSKFGTGMSFETYELVYSKSLEMNWP